MILCLVCRSPCNHSFIQNWSILCLDVFHRPILQVLNPPIGFLTSKWSFVKFWERQVINFHCRGQLNILKTKYKQIKIAAPGKSNQCCPPEIKSSTNEVNNRIPSRSPIYIYIYIYIWFIKVKICNHRKQTTGCRGDEMQRNYQLLTILAPPYKRSGKTIWDAIEMRA